MVEALLKEMELRSDYLTGETIGTYYFGGGTPSLLDPSNIQSLIEKAKSLFQFDPGAEITLEANPDDISEEKLKDWASAGINRLSIGVQSFFADDLVWMNRAHTASQAVSSLQLAVSHFENISIDLIYGTPSLTDEKWKKNVEMAIAFNIPHLSCYALTVELKTPLDKMIQQKRSENVDPDKQSAQFLLLMDWMMRAGYEHYEISNFSKPGWRSRHNSSYWEGKKYLGIGPSAHSYDGRGRQWNVSNNNIYMESVLKGHIPYEEEILTPVQQLNEYIMTSLRTIEGLDLIKLAQLAGHDNSFTPDTLIMGSKKYIETGLLKHENNRLQLTNEGKLLADGIAADLFY